MFLIKGRQFLVVSAVLCALAVGVPLTQKILARIHLRTIGGKMKSSLGALLGHFVHITPKEFEAYIIEGPGIWSHSVESHLTVCKVCREEVAIVRHAIDDFESKNPGNSIGAGELWPKKDAGIWINDEMFALKPLPSVRGKALVHGLSLRRLDHMIEQDSRCPGTYLLSVEIGFKEVIVPLSDFYKITPDKDSYVAARREAKAWLNSNQVSPLVKYASEKLGFQIIGSADDSVALFGFGFEEDSFPEALGTEPNQPEMLNEASPRPTGVLA